MPDLPAWLLWPLAYSILIAALLLLWYETWQWRENRRARETERRLMELTRETREHAGRADRVARSAEELEALWEMEAAS